MHLSGGLGVFLSRKGTKIAKTAKKNKKVFKGNHLLGGFCGLGGLGVFLFFTRRKDRKEKQKPI
jgi:hypothetical protein